MNWFYTVCTNRPINDSAYSSALKNDTKHAIVKNINVCMLLDRSASMSCRDSPPGRDQQIITETPYTVGANKM